MSGFPQIRFTFEGSKYRLTSKGLVEELPHGVFRDVSNPFPVLVTYFAKDLRERVRKEVRDVAIREGLLVSESQR